MWNDIFYQEIDKHKVYSPRAKRLPMKMLKNILVYGFILAVSLAWYLVGGETPESKSTAIVIALFMIGASLFKPSFLQSATQNENYIARFKSRNEKKAALNKELKKLEEEEKERAIREAKIAKKEEERAAEEAARLGS